jgi:hypothetical protein
MNVARSRWTIGLLLALLAGCSSPSSTPVEQLPSVEATLQAVGRRLSRSLSADELSRLATRSGELLGKLTAAERDALGRGYLRFRVDRASVVDVAVPSRSIPFWIADQGFTATGWTLTHPDSTLLVYRKPFEAGWVGLGVNGLDWSSASHYAVFIRGRGGEAGTVNLQMADSSQVRYRLVTASEGVSLACDAEKPVGRLPDALRGATLLQMAHGARHATLLARGRVWKTHVPSRHEPDQVVVSFGESSSRSLVWSWRTDPSVSQTVLKLAPTGSRSSPPHSVRLVRGTSRLVETPNLLNDPAIRRHRVHFDGLEPETTYAYALGDGSDDGWSSWHVVRTAPERQKTVQFLYLGDAQCGLEKWGKLLRRARERYPHAGFILLAGDLVDRGNERTNWDHFFLRAAGVFDSIPLMPCVGNHEYLDQGPRLFRAFFDLPARSGSISDLVYSFEYSDVFIAVLDSTEAVSDPRSAQRQARWLDTALANTRATWRLVMFHHPVYASHPTREYPDLAAAWVPVFDKHQVDLVLQGHDHAYMRTYPLRHGRKAEKDGDGTVYVLAVSGDKFCPQRTTDTTQVGFTDRSTYQTIDIDARATRLVFRAWDIDDREWDRFVIEKPEQSAPPAMAGNASSYGADRRAAR